MRGPGQRMRELLARGRARLAARHGSAAYWTRHLVPTQDWTDAQASLEHFHWRNAQYPGYIELMPVHGADGLAVVDYGCGPGNDLAGFAAFSRPRRLVGVDVSPTALAIARGRLALHGADVELLQIREDDNAIPIESESVDLVHSSGVLHHARHPRAALAEIRRILRPGGRLRVMVYNHDSVWLHLYVAYLHRIERGRDADVPLLDAFRRTTDGPDCPISHCYRPPEFVALAESCGFRGRFLGASISLTELEAMARRYAAIRDRRLPREHRDFLGALRFDDAGHPTIGGVVAGIGACYEFTKG